MKKVFFCALFIGISQPTHGMDSQAVVQTVVRACHVCHKSPELGQCEKIFKCSGCQAVLYCSVDCQRNDWKRHKSDCKKNLASAKETVEGQKPGKHVSKAPLSRGKRTPLHWAALTNQFEEAKRLIETDSENPNSADEDGNTVLHFAVFTKNLPLIKYLVERCANINVNCFNKLGSTPFDECFMPPYEPSLKVLEYVKLNGFLRGRDVPKN